MNSPVTITKEMIIKSFKVCGISNAMDSSEDYLFEYPQEILPEVNYDLFDNSYINEGESSSDSYNTDEEK